MIKTLRYLLLLSLILGSQLLFAQSEPWEIKKQRTKTVHQPSFKYRTRDGSKSPAARQTSQQPVVKGTLLSSQLKIREGRTGEPPREIRGELPQLINQAARINTDFPSLAQSYLQEVSELMKITNPTDEFVPQQQWQDVIGNQHIRLHQQYRGVEVYGSEIIVHANQRTVQGLNGRYLSTPELINTTPSVTREEAIQTALAQLSNTVELNDSQRQLLNYTGPQAKLVILPTWEAGEARLAWQVMARPDLIDHWEIMIDAHRGTLIQKTNLTCSFAPEMYLSHDKAKKHDAHHHSRITHSASPMKNLNASQGSGTDLNGVNQALNVWQASDGFGMIDGSKDMFNSPAGTSIKDLAGVIITYDALSKPKPESVSIAFSNTNVFSDPATVSAHYNASVAYDFFRNNHSRSAIDGVGGNILSVVNYVEDDSSGMDNAFWNGTFMVYGNGDVGFTPLAGGLDVGGHEMSHGVIGTTAKLVYRNESGAINEHIADVFGVLIDDDDFQLGEDVVRREVFPTGAMRDMENPHNGGTSLNDNGWQPDHISEIYTGEEDNGGVHINSGIPNRAFFLIANELGRDVAADLYYHALTNYLTASSEFVDLRRALLNAANDLFGSVEGQTVTAAFDAVGIVEGIGDDEPGNDDEEDEEDQLPTKTGSEFILTVNTDEDDQDGSGEVNSLYLINLTANEFEPISVTPIKRKPTVTDDGSTAFFITEDETVHGIELTGSYNEQVITDESFWANLSISKDGNRLAIISNQQIPEIWVVDLTKDSDNFMKFDLYNPTSQEGVTTGEVQYADAIEWDYSGEYLIYDAFNQVQGFGFGETVEFWDVGYLKVWNNTADDFGNGEITKIFTNLPRGTSIGNPSFSKTNRNIVCFDLFNELDETYQVIAADLNTGRTNVVYENNTLGFPSYSSDDRFLVFDIIDEDGRPAMGRIELNDDKLSANGDVATPYVEAKWTNWFSQGSRVLNSPNKELLEYEVVLSNSNIDGQISDDTIKLTLPEGTELTNLVASFEASPGSEVYVGEFRQISGVSRNDFTEKVTYTLIAQDGSTREYTVTATVEQTDGGDGGDAGDGTGGDGDPGGDGVITGLGDNQQSLAAAYPNPFSQELQLAQPLPRQYDLRLADVLGRSYDIRVEQQRIIVLEQLTPGVYFLTLQTPHQTQTIRLLRK